MPSWRDISRPIVAGPPTFPGDPPTRVERVMSLADGEIANVTELSMSAHLGTHVDAPVHVLEGAGGVEALALDVLCGGATVVDVRSVMGPVGPDVIAIPPPCPRVLLRTGADERVGPRGADGLGVEAASALVAAGVLVVGTDAVSIAPADDPMPTHEVLLRAGVAIVEGLDLSGVAAGEYELMLAPLLVPGADGAPARAAIRPAGD